MIDTTGNDEGNDLDKTRAGDDGAAGATAEMPLSFQMYSELSKKVYGDSQQALIASDGDGREEAESESSFEFDVTADDIYDLTFF